jgi:hypothetical protein
VFADDNDDIDNDVDLVGGGTSAGDPMFTPGG